MVFYSLRKMNIVVESYPGVNSSPSQIVALADEYRLVASSLMTQRRPRKPLSRAPSRLCTIEAIEVYLNAFLMSGGVLEKNIRAYLHNLDERAALAHEKGLILRKRTTKHLKKMTEEREYLVSRYGPKMATSLSKITRLMATLNEIAMKVGQRVSLESIPAARRQAGASST